MTNLQPRFQGSVIYPTDTNYDQARAIFYGSVDKKPAVIIQAINEKDVAEAINVAKEENMELAIKSGGHGFAGHGMSDGGITLDLQKMKTIDIDEDNKTAWAGSGLTAREFLLETSKHGLAVGFGDTGSVGLGGITLGGGIGFLVRKHGMTIDNVLAAKIVTADGQILEIDKDNYPDLFWAIRGGGGNFGVVTHFKFQLQPVDDVIGGMMILPLKPKYLTEFMSLAETAPNELSSILNVMPCPPMPFVSAEHHGKLIMMALMTYAGDREEGEKVLAPFKKIATPIADMVKPSKYVDMFPPDEGSYHPTAVSQTMFMKHVDLELAKTIIEQLEASDASMRVVQLRVLGGKMAEVPSDATAFAHRQSKILANVAAFYETPENKIERAKWVENLSALLNQGDNGVYVNFLGPDDQNRIHDAYPGETWEKLVTIKQKYDPTNFFRLNYNIA